MQKIVELLEKAFDQKARIEGNVVKVNVSKITSWNALDMDKMKNIVSDFEIRRSGAGLLIIATGIKE